jgi:hypothetical protein
MPPSRCATCRYFDFGRLNCHHYRQEYIEMTLANKYGIKMAENQGLPQRHAQVGETEGNRIEVACLFHPGEDRYVTHVYITAADDIRRKLPMTDNLADSEREAFAKGWAHVDAFFQS